MDTHCGAAQRLKIFCILGLGLSLLNVALEPASTASFHRLEAGLKFLGLTPWSMAPTRGPRSGGDEIARSDDLIAVIQERNVRPVASYWIRRMALSLIIKPCKYRI